jgi:hypothetical protein
MSTDRAAYNLDFQARKKGTSAGEPSTNGHGVADGMFLVCATDVRIQTSAGHTRPYSARNAFEHIRRPGLGNDGRCRAAFANAMASCLAYR